MTDRTVRGAVLAGLLLLAAGAAHTQDATDGAAPAADAAASADTTAADASAAAAIAADPNLAVASEQDGRHYTADDVPTFLIEADGTVDWMTYSGFRRYHSECHVCHGPDGEGSSYAPALKNSALALDYYTFYDTVVNGKQEVGGGNNRVMPAFGDNPNVMCYLDDIYVYLKARGAEAIPRGRPAAHAPKSDVVRADEDSCLGT